MPELTLFDLDHTLLDGDSDTLWCAFLLEHGLLDPGFEQRNAEMARRYRAGAVAPPEFCAFYASTLAGRSRAQWQPWRERFLREIVRPRLPQAAHALVRRHRDAGDLVLLTTATNRFITELTAAELDIGHLVATELEEVDGRFSGRTCGSLNMREGKVERMHAWIAGQGLDAALLERATFYSDSINDLPLLSAVARPVVVDPDPQLLEAARGRGWPLVSIHRDG